MEQNYLIYAVIAVGIFTGYMAIVNLLRRDKLRDRMRLAGSALPLQTEEKTPAMASFCSAILGMIGVDIKNQKALSMQLLQGGVQSPYAVTYFLFFKRILQPIFLAIGGFLFVSVLLAADMSAAAKAKGMVFGIILITIGMGGANLYITNKKQHRQQKLLYSFPEALDLLLVCIESGLGLDAAFSRVCTEVRTSHPEVAQELERTRVELTVLPDRTQALQNLAERTEIVPFKSLVASLIQTEKFGTSLLDTLRVLSDEQRTTRLLNAENRAARIPVLITIPLILCTLPALIIVILAPPFIHVAGQGGVFGSKTPN